MLVIYQVSAIQDDFPITAKEIGKANKVDAILSKLHHFIVSGWPGSCPDESIPPFHNRKLELSCEQGCELWGSSVVIPPVLRKKILKALHSDHPGVCGIKAIAGRYIWWPKMDEDTEQAVSVCTVCQSVRKILHMRH